jgi:hypothetical protein
LAAAKSESDASVSWPLWSGLASGAFALAAAGVGIWAAHDASTYHALLAGPTTRQDLDALGARTQREAVVSDVLLGAAIITGAMTVILLLTSDRHVERP